MQKAIFAMQGGAQVALQQQQDRGDAESKQETQAPAAQGLATNDGEPAAPSAPQQAGADTSLEEIHAQHALRLAGQLDEIERLHAAMQRERQRDARDALDAQIDALTQQMAWTNTSVLRQALANAAPGSASSIALQRAIGMRVDGEPKAATRLGKIGEKLRAAAAELVRRTMTQAEIDGVLTISDWFGGGDAYSTALANTIFKNVREIRINEYAPVRRQRIQYMLEHGADFARDFVTRAQGEIASANEILTALLETELGKGNEKQKTSVLNSFSWLKDLIGNFFDAEGKDGRAATLDDLFTTPTKIGERHEQLGIHTPRRAAHHSGIRQRPQYARGYEADAGGRVAWAGNADGQQRARPAADSVGERGGAVPEGTVARRSGRVGGQGDRRPAAGVTSSASGSQAAYSTVNEAQAAATWRDIGAPQRTHWLEQAGADGRLAARAWGVHMFISGFISRCSNDVVNSIVLFKRYCSICHSIAGLCCR